MAGTDETLADIVHARHTYGPDDILWERRFVDVLTVHPSGRREVNLRRFHETEAVSP
jgi:inward rectifier potassium channel